jgi:TRAP-type uncharacterized transport system substrate-binding protein
MFRVACLLFSIMLMVPVGIATAQQKRPTAAPSPANISAATLPGTEALNAGTVTVVTAPIGGPMSIMGSDLANVLDDGENLRVLPILGKGSVQNLIDVLRLKNVDMGFVASDALEFVRAEYNIPDIATRVCYITQLFHNDIHIVARREIQSLSDLAGKRVFAERNLGYPSARIIFQRLGIQATFDSTTDADGGLQRLLNGEGDAWIVSTGKNAPVIKNIKNEGGKVHLLSIPYERSLQDIYLPSSFSSDEYPNLVAPGTQVDTLATPVVLMVYNWPVQSDRYRRVARFVDAMFDKIGQLKQPPRHPKWRDTALAVAVPGLQRFKAAQDWLVNDAAAAKAGVGAGTVGQLGPSPNAAGASRSSEESAKLFNEFRNWKRERDLQR